MWRENEDLNWLSWLLITVIGGTLLASYLWDIYSKFK